MNRIYTEMLGGNKRWTIYLSENRNENILTIHDNSWGKTVYTNENIYDTDVFKLVRLLDTIKYDHLKIEQIIKKINSKCRHLNINYIPTQTGGLYY